MRIEINNPQYIYELGMRSNQEDNLFPSPGTATASDRIFVVCDGMGGHEKGELASELVSRTVGERLKANAGDSMLCSDEQIAQAISHAYDELDRHDTQSVRKMGTTLTLVALHRGGVTAAHIGDSRIYHIRPKDKKILYKSRDHSLVNELFYSGNISRKQMINHPRKNIITRAMQPNDPERYDNRPQADIAHITDVKTGDYFLLCSDGVVETMRDFEILDLMARDDLSDEQKAQQMRTLTNGSSDNHTAYFFRVKSVERERGDETLLDNESKMHDWVIDMPDDDVRDDFYITEVVPLQEQQDSAEQNRHQAAKKKNRIMLLLISCLLCVAALAVFLYNNLNKKMPKKTNFAVEKQENKKSIGSKAQTSQKRSDKQKEKMLETASEAQKPNVKKKAASPTR